MKLSLDEVASRMGCARSTAKRRLEVRGITGKLDPNSRAKLYEVDEDLLTNWEIPKVDMRSQGYVTAADIARKSGTSSVNVLTKLKESCILPDYRDPVLGSYMWKDRPELYEAVTLRKRREAQQTEDEPYENVFTGISKGYKGVLKGSGLDILKQEREKKQWIGRRGRLVVDGHVVAEGIIESVSMCGVFIKGNYTKGNIDELELCE